MAYNTPFAVLNYVVEQAMSISNQSSNDGKPFLLAMFGELEAVSFLPVFPRLT